MKRGIAVPQVLRVPFLILHSISWMMFIYLLATHWVWIVGKIIGG